MIAGSIIQSMYRHTLDEYEENLLKCLITVQIIRDDNHVYLISLLCLVVQVAKNSRNKTLIRIAGRGRNVFFSLVRSMLYWWRLQSFQLSQESSL